MDGTLTQTSSGAQFRKNERDWEFKPGIKWKVHNIHNLYPLVRLAVATNQGGVAFSYLSPNDLKIQIEAAATELRIPYVLVEFRHPNGTVPAFKKDTWRRKPGPGMIYEAILKHDVEPEETLYVGDRSEDQEAARRAGVHFMWATEFFDQDFSERSKMYRTRVGDSNVFIPIDITGSYHGKAR
jgi:D-glycero-D-manno-heptose 1,7-bisphosphate phosphatase